jgi:glucose-1-phosphate cytidylyltransferase
VKVVILAGGLGTRLSEETVQRPKPMVEIGDRPILWHIMKIYASHGLSDFVVCLGYKGYVIKEFFANYFLHMSNVTFDLATNTMEVHQRNAEPWRVTLVDTGDATQTGGRIRRVADHVGDTFCMTYGDGLGDIDIGASIAFHREHGRKCTITAVQPPGRFGALDLAGDRVVEFREKPVGDGAWINGGFAVLSKDAIAHIDGDDSLWEHEPLQRLVAEDQLRAWRHTGFWQPMDTLRDKGLLEELWRSGRAPWKRWT